MPTPTVMWAGTVVAVVVGVVGSGMLTFESSFPHPHQRILCPSTPDKSSRPHEGQVCVQHATRDGTPGHTLMIATCEAAWQDYEVQEQCLRGTTIPDALLGVPHTNTSTGHTYVNAYCAICNGEDPTRLKAWLTILVCEDAGHVLDRADHYNTENDDDDYDYDSEDDGSANYSGVDYDHYDHIVYFTNGTWGVFLSRLNVSTLHPCHSTIADPTFAKQRHHEVQRPSHNLTLILLLSVNLQICSPEEMRELESSRCRKINCIHSDEKFHNGRCVSSTQDTVVSMQGLAVPHCPIRHTCIVPNLSDRGCSCDASCREYGDCCLDSEYYDMEQQMKNFASLTCVGESTPVYMKTKCSENWGDEKVQALCLKGNKTADSSARLFPVTSTTTAHTYVNHYCAICNGEDPTHLRVWLARLGCDGNWPSFFCNPHDEDFITVFRESDSDEGVWGIVLPSWGLSSFKPCSLVFEVPEDMKNYTRECDPDLVTTCGSEAQEHQRDLCQSYAATVYQRNRAFRNQHCATCTGYDQYRCVPDYYRTVNPDFNLLVPLNSSDNGDSNLVGFTGQCGGEVWDRQTSKFMKYFCNDTEVSSYILTAPNCLIHHSCTGLDQLSQRGCSCDISCMKYGDCCRDSQYYDDVEQMKNFASLTCVDGPTPVYMKAKCSEDWVDEEVQALCLKGNKAHSGDVRLFPVTSTTTAHTYVNHYCAICNGEDKAHLRVWLARLRKLSEISCISGSRDEDYSIVFHEESWGIMVPNCGLLFFDPDFLAFEVPGDMKNYTRECNPELVTTCGSEAQEHQRVLCQSYSATVYWGGLVFRNQHCASCNGYDQYTCVKMQCDSEEEVRASEASYSYGKSRSVFTLSMLLDFSDTSGSNFVGSSDQCGGEVWDRFSGKYRKMFCSNTVASIPTMSYCPIHHSCAGSHQLSDRGCSCDAFCREYGDCCLDSEYYDMEQQMKNFASLTCVSELKPVYMKTKCSEDWGDEKVQALCLKRNKTADSSARLFPVTSTTTAHTYVNHYCAICNGEDPAHLRVWLARLEMESEIGCLSQSRDEDYSIVFHEGRWGVMLPSCGLSSFNPGSLTFEVPEDMKNYTRECNPELVTTCGSKAQEHQRVLCQSYTATVYWGGRVFRNQHCASCNDYDQYTCVKTIWKVHIIKLYSSTMLLDSLNPSGNNFLGFTGQCGSEVLDRESGKYRKVFCNITAASAPSAAGKVTRARMSKSFFAPAYSPPHHPVSKQVDSAVNTTESGTVAGTSTATEPGTAAGTSTATEPDTAAGTSTATEPDTAAGTSTATEPGTAAGTSTATEPGTAAGTSTATKPGTAAGTSTATKPGTAAGTTTIQAASGSVGKGHGNCSMVLLSEAEFDRQSDGSVHVPAYGHTFHAGEYKVKGSGVLVCWHRQKFSAVLGWVSRVGLSLSCLALVLHLAAFCLVPNLRNLAGKCLASLCLSLLAASTTMLASAPLGEAGCGVLAAARYYFWLCCFAWMTTMAQDVWRAFRLSHKQLRVAGGAETRRFLAYSLCCWLLPAACTALVVTVNQLEPLGVPEEFLPGLGDRLCWFSHRKSLLAFFYGPIAVLTAMNVVFFASTAALIARLSRGAVTASSAPASLQRQRYCSLVRLAAVMGLAWVVAVVASYFSWEPLRYLSEILNSLQGVFIFLAFTCRSKVLQEVRGWAPTLLQRTANLATGRPPPPAPAPAQYPFHSQGTSTSTV